MLPNYAEVDKLLRTKAVMETELDGQLKHKFVQVWRNNRQRNVSPNWQTQ